MELIDCWYPPPLRDTGAPPTATRAGSLVFLSAQLPFEIDAARIIDSVWDLPPSVLPDFATGLEHRDGREGPAKAQTRTVYQHIRAALEHHGLSPEDIVRQRIYVRHPEDMPTVEEAMLREFPGRKPATTFACMSPRGARRDVLVQVEIIAADRTAIDVEDIHVAELEEIAQPYPPAVRVGQYLFTSGLIGINAATGRVAKSMNELDGADRVGLFKGRYFWDSVEEAAKAQLGFIFKHLRAILEAVDTPPSSLLRKNYLTTLGMNEWGAAAIDSRRHLYPPEAAPTITSLCVPSLGNGGERILLEAIALTPGKNKKGVIHAPEIAMSNLNMVVNAGPSVFTTGYVGMDKDLHSAITKFAELSDQTGRLQGLTRLDDNETLLAQAWHTFSAIGQLLRQAGTDLQRILQQTIYMRDVSRYSVVLGVMSAIYGDRLPPTSVVGVEDIGPYPGLELEVDTIASRA